MLVKAIVIMVAVLPGCQIVQAQKHNNKPSAKQVVASVMPKQTYDKFADRTTVHSANIDGWSGFWFGATFSFQGTERKSEIKYVGLTLALGSDYWPSLAANPALRVLADNKRLTFSQEIQFIAPLRASGLVFYTYDQSLTIQEFKQLACADVTEMQFAGKSFQLKPKDIIALRGVLYLTGNDCKP